MMNLLFLFSIIIYIIKPKWPILVLLIAEPFLAPFMTIFLGITDMKETADFVYAITPGFSRFFLPIILFLFFFRRKPFPADIKKIVPPLAILISFLIVHNAFIFFDPIIIYRDTTGAIYSSLPFLFFMLDKKARPNIKQLFAVIILIYVVELFWIPLNMEGIFAYVGRYEEVMKGIEEASLMPGTFLRSNHLSDFVAITYFFIMCDYYLRGSMPKWMFCCISAIAVLLLFVAGSKTPIISVFVSFMLLLILNKKKKVVFSISIVLLAVLTLIFSNGDKIKGDTSNEGFNRVIDGITDFTKTKSKGETDYSTFGISTELINRYFYESPLFGCGYSYRGIDKAYPLNKHYAASDLTHLISDATFAYYLVEFGVVGVLLYLFYYVRLVQIASRDYGDKRKILTLVIFVFFLLFSITEGGIFVTTYMWYVLFYLMAVDSNNSDGQKTIAAGYVRNNK